MKGRMEGLHRRQCSVFLTLNKGYFVHLARILFSVIIF